jgi:hypothetical protein
MGKTKWRWRMTAVVLAVGLGMLVPGPTAEAQKTKGKTRAAETKFLMRGVMQPNCAALANLLKEKGPATEKAWDQATQHAAILNEMSYVVMDDGRCPDKAWADAAKTLRECSGKALAAVKEKKTEDAQAAFKALTGACQACHKVHRHDE